MVGVKRLLRWPFERLLDLLERLIAGLVQDTRPRGRG